jgi:phytoene dehydrogenase-like protein
MVSLGVSKTYKEYPHLFRFPLQTPVISPDGTEYNRLEWHIYHYDPTMAPEGKTIVVVSLYTYHSDFWIRMRDQNYNQYATDKNILANAIVKRLEERIPGIGETIEVMDVATPATYYRYTNNWKGSVQGWLPDKHLLASSPIDTQLPGLSDFYMCSHWSVPGGGLPVTIKTSRDLSQNICLKYKKTFSIR